MGHASCGGAVPLMDRNGDRNDDRNDDRSNDRSNDRSDDLSKGRSSSEKANAGRQLHWTVDRIFQGWTCSLCEWNYPLPTLLNDPEAKTAYDRLAAAKFRTHDCADHRARMVSTRGETFTARIRNLVAHGYKPKDAVDLMVQEVAMESPNQPKILAQAKAEGEDFLRRLKAGLI